MKTLIKLTVIVLILFHPEGVKSQDTTKQASQDFQPLYVTMTTAHWSEDPNIDFKDWLATEKEYFQKVTSKNDLILNSGFYTHYFTPDNSEVIMVNVYKDWGDIQKADKRNQELLKAAWPDEAKRKEFLDKQSAYYSADHKDEIYQTMNYSIQPPKNTGTTPRIFYVRSSNLAMNGQGSPEQFKEYFEKITKKAKTIKGYYTHRHLWGSNSREMNEVYVFDKLGDIETFFDEEQKLVESTWTNEEERKKFLDEKDKSFTGKHGDYIYRSVPELLKSNQ